MNKALDNIQVIAEKSRHEFETGRVDISLLFDLFERHLPKSVHGQSWRIGPCLPHFPNSNGTLASLYLLHRIGAGEITPVYYGPQSHTVLVVGATALGTDIVDITADQFGGPPVYAGPLVRPWSITLEAVS